MKNLSKSLRGSAGLETKNNEKKTNILKKFIQLPTHMKKLPTKYFVKIPHSFVDMAYLVTLTQQT